MLQRLSKPKLPETIRGRPHANKLLPDSAETIKVQPVILAVRAVILPEVFCVCNPCPSLSRFFLFFLGFFLLARILFFFVRLPFFSEDFIRGFEKGLADRGAMPEVQTSFLHNFSDVPLGEGEHNSGNLFAVFWVL